MMVAAGLSYFGQLYMYLLEERGGHKARSNQQRVGENLNVQAIPYLLLKS